MNVSFTFSDTIAGYVSSYNSRESSFTLRTSDDREFTVYLNSNTYAKYAFNLTESYQDATGEMPRLLALPRQFVYAYGTFYPAGESGRFEAQWLVFPGRGPGVYRQEEPNWWINQSRSIGNSYLKWQFNHPCDEINYRNYRTMLHLAGTKKGDYLQETDTITRLVYGFATAYMLTGEEPFLEAAEKGTIPARSHAVLRPGRKHRLLVSRHQRRRRRETRCLRSEFGDDFDAIPAYEQIYALAGPIQTYRVTGDPRILWDAEKTVDLFERFFLDNEKGGYFSHLDPITLDPRSRSPGRTTGRKKNWNSVGDHAPAYLINLYLATGEPKYCDDARVHIRHHRQALPGLRRTAPSSRRSSSRTGATTRRMGGSRTAPWSATTSRSPGT